MALITNSGCEFLAKLVVGQANGNNAWVMAIGCSDKPEDVTDTALHQFTAWSDGDFDGAYIQSSTIAISNQFFSLTAPTEIGEIGLYSYYSATLLARHVYPEKKGMEEDDWYVATMGIIIGP
jgi:hypothetical protein